MTDWITMPEMAKSMGVSLGQAYKLSKGLKSKIDPLRVRRKDVEAIKPVQRGAALGGKLYIKMEEDIHQEGLTRAKARGISFHAFLREAIEEDMKKWRQ